MTGEGRCFALSTDLVPVRLNARATGRSTRSAALRALGDAIGHRDVPFDEVVRALGASRAATTRPLARHIANSRHQKPPRRTADLEWMAAPPAPDDAPYDTSWDLEFRGDGGAVMELVHDRRYIADGTAARLHARVLSGVFPGLVQAGRPDERRKDMP